MELTAYGYWSAILTPFCLKNRRNAVLPAGGMS